MRKNKTLSFSLEKKLKGKKREAHTYFTPILEREKVMTPEAVNKVKGEKSEISGQRKKGRRGESFPSFRPKVKVSDRNREE